MSEFVKNVLMMLLIVIFSRNSDTDIISMLNRMSLSAQALPDQSIEVKIPPIRHDVIHACDIIEDVAIAVGYNNIPKVLPATSTVSNQV